MFAPGDKSTKVGFYLKGAENFSTALRMQIAAWRIVLVKGKDFLRVQYHEHPHELDAAGNRVLRDPRDIDVDCLPGISSPSSPNLYNMPPLLSCTFHVPHHADDIPPIVLSHQRMRATETNRRKPIIIWEPPLTHFRTSIGQSFTRALEYVDILFVDTSQLAAVHGLTTASMGLSEESIAGRAQAFFQGIEGLCCMIVSSPWDGYYLCSKHVAPRWFPQYHPMGSAQFVDRTGASSAFLGAFAMSFIEQGSVLRACECGVVSASLVVEQRGLPKLQKLGWREFWNGVDVQSRLREYRSRLGWGPERGQTFMEKQDDQSKEVADNEVGEAREVRLPSLARRLMLQNAARDSRLRRTEASSRLHLAAAAYL